MRRVFLVACMSLVLAILAMPVQAQQWSAEQLEVWEVISKQWEFEKTADLAWTELLHPSFQGWPIGLPMPVDKEDAKRFFAAEVDHAKTLMHDLAPVAIIVVENTAIAHYYYTVLTGYPDGEQEMDTGRSTDILIRTEDGWKYLGWVGDERAAEKD